jgi:hypothetical protein
LISATGIGKRTAKGSSGLKRKPGGLRNRASKSELRGRELKLLRRSIKARSEEAKKAVGALGQTASFDVSTYLIVRFQGKRHPTKKGMESRIKMLKFDFHRKKAE